MAKPFSLGVLASKSGWHFQDLERAANNAPSEYSLSSLDFRQLSAQIAENKSSDNTVDIISNGNQLSKFDAIFARVMPAGTLEQIVFRMDALNRLESQGTRIINSPRAIEIAVDKFLSLAILSQQQILAPETYVAQTASDAERYFNELDGSAVLKPLFGSLGNGVVKLSDDQQAHNAFQVCQQAGKAIYLQKFIDTGGTDFRFFVIGEKVWSIKRTAKPGDWITNVHQGGTPSMHQPTAAESELAIRSARATKCEIAGIDVAYDQETGEPYVLEVNAAPGWQAISKTLEVDFANEILVHCATEVC